MDNMIINRTTINGTKWEIVGGLYGAALYMNNIGKDGYHYSGFSFNSVEDANAYLDKVDERCSAPAVFSACEVPSDYYGVANRYYGD